MSTVGLASLLIRGGPNNGAVISLSSTPLTMGRRPDNDVVVDEATVSRRHSLIMETPRGYVLRDLNTTNGTYINQNRLTHDERLLQHGDQIKLGGSVPTFVFRQESPQTLKMETALSQVVPAMSEPGTDLIQDLDDKDTKLIAALASKKGSVVSRRDLFAEIWPEIRDEADLNAVLDAAVERVRTQLKDDPNNNLELVTVGRFGFVLA